MKNEKYIKGYVKITPEMLKDFSEIEKEQLQREIKKLKRGPNRNSK